MLNDNDDDPTNRLSQQPSQTPQHLPPPMPSLQTSRSSHTPSAFAQASPAGPASYGQPPYGPPHYLERRSSSYQSQYSHMPAGSPTTPHTPDSRTAYPPPRQYSQPQHYQQSPFHHPPLGTPSNRQDALSQASLYTPSPQSDPSSSTNRFGPALRESPSQMPPPRESPNSWGSRQTSVTSGQTPTTMLASAPQYPPQHSANHSESPLVTNGRSSLSVSPKTKPIHLLNESSEISNSPHVSSQQEGSAASRARVEAQHQGKFDHLCVNLKTSPTFTRLDIFPLLSTPFYIVEYVNLKEASSSSITPAQLVLVHAIQPVADPSARNFVNLKRYNNLPEAIG